ncbi:MAG: hypothetical protein ABI920_14040, partial [Casimicrobiaceae bacterium]
MVAQSRIVVLRTFRGDLEMSDLVVDGVVARFHDLKPMFVDSVNLFERPVRESAGGHTFSSACFERL